MYGQTTKHLFFANCGPLFWFWNLAANANRVALLLWDDHLGGVQNYTLLSSLASSGPFPYEVATSYVFGNSSDAGLSLDPAAGITNMRFSVDGKLEDQGGVGFAVQDGFAFSTTSCFFDNNRTAQYDVAVRNDVNLTSLYIETEQRDSTSMSVSPRPHFSPPPVAQQTQRIPSGP
ncbi:hypothetical protein C8F04DRAFT_75587 [Mycena alexandri]|uniref:Uncharacterized protein n=1 Tax=Mycena alexandri TaxID=1745969 RepID=A0AAD6XA65_9AGAR|nr:hypothetical protein C8F04DRAFT_75587 [Mycena alexandri]